MASDDLQKASNAVHVASTIFRNIGISRRRRESVCLRGESFPEGWEDCIVVGSIARNKDGSITISCQIDVHSDDGKCWGVDSREIRLPRKK